MGVLNCSRKGCDNIMCDTYVQSIGYICNECKSEFKEFIQLSGRTPKTEGQIIRSLKQFMLSEKYSYTEGREKTIDEFFDDYTNNE